MSSEADFQCPVCRARQSLRETCRRCKADLTLVMQAYGRWNYLREQYEQALADQDHRRASSIAMELDWLAPHR